MDVFVGRTAELVALQDAMADVEAGLSQTVMLMGPAGIGKTSLLDQFLSELHGVRLIRAGGEEWEALVAYGVVDQILRAAGVRAGYLIASRSRALPPEEPVSVGALLLETLTNLGHEQPVVLVVDDIHWADIDSLRALTFALRRVGQDRLLTLLVARNEDSGRLPTGLTRLAAGTTGRTIKLGALDGKDIKELANAFGVPRFSLRTANRLRDHTRGNPLYIGALLTELPADRWQSWEPTLPAPRAFADQIVSRLVACSESARALVEACAVLGVRSSLQAAAGLIELGEPVDALEEAVAVELLHTSDTLDFRDLAFPHPLIRAAVYESITPARRVKLHRAAAQQVEDPGTALRHLVAATLPPDSSLADRLDAFAKREMAWGGWASAASALIEASRFSAERQEREERLLRAVDALASAGDLPQAAILSREISTFVPGPLRDAAMGYMAVLGGQLAQAQSFLTKGWEQAKSAGDQHLGALLALRWTLYSVGRLRGTEIVEWSDRSIDLAPRDPAVWLEAEALRGLGLGLMGQVREGVDAYQSILQAVGGDESSIVGRIMMAKSWLHIVLDEIETVPEILADVAPAQLRNGSIRIAAWSYVWLSRAHHLRGDWDAAADAAERAVAILEDTGHEWLRPLTRWVAVQTCANRGHWQAAGEHVAQAGVGQADAELMIVASALAAAELAWARGEHEEVLNALKPILDIPSPRQGVDEPGFWPWQHLYADALISLDQIDEAAAFVVPYEEAAAERGRRSSMARLARVRGRLEASRGRLADSEKAFRFGLKLIAELSLPFDQALLELAFGQMLRRRGSRRAAHEHLTAALELFTALDAVPHVERCRIELDGVGLKPSRRRHRDPTQLTRQELAVARLAASGKTTREIADQMSISVKTVQFHLGNVYSKVGAHTRVQLANYMAAAAADTESRENLE